MSSPVTSGHEPKDGPTTREWIKAVVYLGIALVLVTMLLWFTVTFMAQPCGAVPACG